MRRRRSGATLMDDLADNGLWGMALRGRVGKVLASEKGNPLKGDFRDIGFGDVALLGEALVFATVFVFDLLFLKHVYVLRPSTIIAHMTCIKIYHMTFPLPYWALGDGSKGEGRLKKNTPPLGSAFFFIVNIVFIVESDEDIYFNVSYETFFNELPFYDFGFHMKMKWKCIIWFSPYLTWLWGMAVRGRVGWQERDVGGALEKNKTPVVYRNEGVTSGNLVGA